MEYNAPMATVLFDMLQENPVFSDLSQADREKLAGMAICRQYSSGHFLTQAGDCWPFLFLVSKGRLNVMKESIDGRSLVIAELRPGELFWGLAFFQEDVPNPMTIQVNLASTLYLWRRGEILPFLLENGRLTWELSRLMVNRMLLASEVIESLAFQPVAGRLARLLLGHFASTGEESIERSLTLDEMAARIGTTREMVCRALYRFADKKLIEVTKTEFVLTDKSGLMHVADGS